MSEHSNILQEMALTHGDVSPEKMQQALEVILMGKSTTSSYTSDESSTDSSSEDNNIGDGKSKQLQGDPFETMAAGEYVPPRYRPELWAAAMEQNTRLGRAIRTYSRNTVGLGWYVEPEAKVSPETSQEERDLIANQTLALRTVFERPNEKMPLSTLFYMVKVDEEATGNGYIEIVRNAAGQIVKLYHVPSVTMRIRITKTGAINGFVQIRGNDKRYFKVFDDTRAMNAITGEYHTQGGPLPTDKRATEIIHFKLYSPTSAWYGAPRYVSCAPAISGNRLASIRNVKFFENDAVPRMALLVSGGRLTPEGVQAIEDFFRGKVQGNDKAHGVVVVQAEQQKVGFQNQGENVRMELKPLTVGVTEDASFGQYRKANDEEIRECFGIAPVFFSSENVNKSCLTGDTKVALLDGRSLTMEELVSTYGDGTKFGVYSVGINGSVVQGVAHSPRMTKTADIWEVTLDSGDVIQGTDDHLFMLLDGTYKALAQLRSGDGLKPHNCKARKVTNVVKTDLKLPVYDITVEEYHNFALHSGIFVHNSAQVGREITNEQEFEPDRLEKEYIINQTLVRDLLDSKSKVRFRFERLKLTDPLDTARMDQTYASLGALTPNELRESVGKPAYPKSYEFADKPMQVAMAELSMQLAEAIMGEWKANMAHQKEQMQMQQEASGMGGMLGGMGGGGAAPQPPTGGAPQGGADAAGGAQVEQSYEDASTDESSPYEEETVDSTVGRYHEALGLDKSQPFPIDTLLGMAGELMRDARHSNKDISLMTTKEAD